MTSTDTATSATTSTTTSTTTAARTQPTLVPAHSPNVWAFSHDNGRSVWTVFKSHPGHTSPRAQMRTRAADGSLNPAVDIGAIDDPERFGPHGTLAQFRDFVARFFAPIP